MRESSGGRSRVALVSSVFSSPIATRGPWRLAIELQGYFRLALVVTGESLRGPSFSAVV